MEKSREEFSSLRHSYFPLFFFSVHSLRLALTGSVASPLPFSPSFIPSGNSKPSEWISINCSSNSLLQKGRGWKVKPEGRVSLMMTVTAEWCVLRGGAGDGIDGMVCVVGGEMRGLDTGSMS